MCRKKYVIRKEMIDPFTGEVCNTYYSGNKGIFSGYSPFLKAALRMTKSKARKLVPLSFSINIVPLRFFIERFSKPF